MDFYKISVRVFPLTWNYEKPNRKFLSEIGNYRVDFSTSFSSSFSNIFMEKP